MGYEEAELSGEIVLDTGSQVVSLVQDPARPGAYLVRIGGTDQSYVDLADPLRLEFDYVQRIADVVDEIAATRITERGETRADDRATEAAMEDRKREGYF